MTGAIGAVADRQAAGVGVPVGVLAAQLDRYRKQLAESCNCPSAKTQEGKNHIQELQSRVESLKTRIERAGRTSRPPDNAALSPESRGGGHSAIRDDGRPRAYPVGQRIDVFV